MKKHANFGILPSFFAVARKCHSRRQVGTLVIETALLKKIACTLLEFDTAIFGHAHYYFFIFNSVLNGGKGGPNLAKRYRFSKRAVAVLGPGEL